MYESKLPKEAILEGRLQPLRALVLVDAVAQEPLATVPRQPKRVRRTIVDDDED